MKTSTLFLLSASVAILSACNGATATPAAEPAADQPPPPSETAPDQGTMAQSPTSMPHGDHGEHGHDDHAHDEAMPEQPAHDHSEHAHGADEMDNVLEEGEYDPGDLVEQPGAAIGDITTCLVSGEVFRITDDSPFFEHEGEVVYFCCPSCIRRFQRNPDAYLGANDGAADGGMVEVAAGGSRFDPPVDKARVPTGNWICDMGTVHYASPDQGDGSCPVCGMHLVQH